MKLRVCLLVMLLASPASAAVTKLTIEKITPIAGGYELLEGHFTGALQPTDRRNSIISDIGLAPRNRDGRVEYSATFAIARPTDMTRASGVLVYDVPNRGRGAAMPLEDGHVDVVSGWQGDLEEAPFPDGHIRQTIRVPAAIGMNGQPVTGAAYVRFIDVAAGTSTMPIKGGPLGSQGGRNFEPATMQGARLFSLTDDDHPERQVEVPKTDWALADCTAAPFPGKPDLTKLCIKGGFNPKLAYTLAFTARDPKILGIGFAATRDLVSFLRYDTSVANPLAGKMRWAIGRGVSQSGNFLRGLVDLGMNSDEQDRIVFDGLNPIVAMRMNSMNYRFATPGGLVGLYELGNDGVNWWSDHDDAVRGIGRHGLLDRCGAVKQCPKIVEIMGSTEFWDLRASADFVGADARADIPLPDNVRRYYNSGVTHNGGVGGFDRLTPPGGVCVLASNPAPTAPTNRALFSALVEWVTKDRSPPPSIYPTLAAGGLITHAAYDAQFPIIPGVPRPAYAPLQHYDFSADHDFNVRDVSGVLNVAPPHVIGTIPQLVPRIDADGNEMDGIRSPLMAAPLGSYVGWNVTAAGYQAGRYCGNTGGYVPFAATRAERLAKGDPRLSLEERYPSHAAYVAWVKAQADALVAQRYMLADDAAKVVAQAQAATIP